MRDSMTIQPFTDDINGQHFAEFDNNDYGTAEVSGWITEDDVVIFSENCPMFHPQRGIKLVRKD